MVHSPAPSPAFEGIATADESRFLLGSVLDEADDNRQQRGGGGGAAQQQAADSRRQQDSSSRSAELDFQLQQATPSSASQSPLSPPLSAAVMPSSIISTLRTVNSSAASSSPSSPRSPGSASASAAHSSQRLVIQPSWLQGHRLDESAAAAGQHSDEDGSGASGLSGYSLKGSPPLMGSGRFSPPSASSFFSQSPVDAVSPAAFAASLQSAEVDQLTARLQQLRMQQQQQQAAMGLSAAEEAAGSQPAHGGVYALNGDGQVRLRSVGSAPHVMMLRGDEEEASGYYGLFDQQQQHRLQLQSASPLSLAELRSSYSPPPARHQRASSLTPSYPSTRPSSSSMPTPQSYQQQQQQQQAAMESQLQLQSQSQRQGGAALFDQPRQRSYSQSPSSASLRSTSVPDYYRPPQHTAHQRNSSPSHAQTAHGSSASSSPYSLSPASSGYSEQPSRLSRPSSLSSLSSFPPSPSLFSQQYASSSLSSILQRGLFLELCMDQYGSRCIQQKLDSCTDEERHAAFLLLTQDADAPQLSPHGHNLVVSLSIDVFANYAVQKMMEVADEAEQSRLCCCLLGSVVLLSLQVYGCRVVQKAIETSHPSLQLLLIAELDADVLQLITDQNGNHVVQKVIEQCPPPMLDFILERTRGHVHRLATHPYGCRVIQRLLEHGSDRQRLLLMDEVILSGAGQGGDDVLLELMRSSFGNYVAQGTLVHGNDWHRHRMCQVVRGRVCALSKHKFASNVMEKCLVHANRDDQQTIIDEIMGPAADEERGGEQRGPGSAAGYSGSHHGLQSPFLELCSDPYGNYMCQRLLNVIEDEQRVDLLWRLEQLLPQLKKIPYGKHILARIERMSFVANTRGIAAMNAHIASSGVVELKDTRTSRRAAASRDSRAQQQQQQQQSGNWAAAAAYPPGFYVNNSSQSGGGGGGGVSSPHGSHSRFASHHAHASKHSSFK